ncbi:MAG: ATP-binding protein, partial [Pseudomonadota bacterium]
VQAVWADTTGGATIHDLISREIEVCNRICPGIDLSPAERRAELEALRDVVVGQLLPRLNALSAANSEWKGFTGIAAKLTVAITFLLVAGAIVLTRSLLVDPLLRQAGQVSERLTLENRELERRVQERTQNLQRALYEAKAAVAARSAFLANMSHEIRTPMNGVLGVAALLERTPLTPQQTTLVSTITQSGSLLLRVINDVLDMASASAGKMQIEDRPTLIREVIMDVMALNEPRAREKGLSLDFDYQKNARYPVMTDPDRIMQVVGNLIGNAIKFTDSGLVMVTLREESRDDQVLVTLSVADTGPGISEADAKRVFEPFEQAGDFGRSEGTGLGLALCQTMVEQMGGRIWLESTLGEGSTFHVDLTLKRARKTDGPVETTRARAIQSGKRSVR